MVRIQFDLDVEAEDVEEIKQRVEDLKDLEISGAFLVLVKDKGETFDAYTLIYGPRMTLLQALARSLMDRPSFTKDLFVMLLAENMRRQMEGD